MSGPSTSLRTGSGPLPCNPCGGGASCPPALSSAAVASPPFAGDGGAFPIGPSLLTGEGMDGPDGTGGEQPSAGAPWDTRVND